MNSIYLRPVVVAAAALLFVSACSTPRNRFPVQGYVPISRSMQPLGELHLSNSLMQLGALEGTMQLQYAGQMTDEAGDDLAGASVYRVKNWSAFFKQNAGHTGFCTEAPRWVVVNSETGAPAWSSEITVGLLTLEDWKKFRPIAFTACVSGAYVRTKD